MARAKKTAAKKKAAPKKTPKKPAPKKPAKIAAKAKAKAPKKAPSKKPAPKKPPAKKPAAPKPAPMIEEAAAAPASDGWAAFPPVLASLVEWVNGGKLEGVDFEMFQAFNEQYKPSDWTRNPASDQELFTFGMDGTGGQVAIWRRDPAAPFDALPIVFLGSEGEISPLATSLPLFLHALASGRGPLELVFGGDEPDGNPEMIAWVQEQYPGVTFKSPAGIFADAKKALADFEPHLHEQVRS
jgi:hypothetical protein